MILEISTGRSKLIHPKLNSFLHSCLKAFSPSVLYSSECSRFITIYFYKYIVRSMMLRIFTVVAGVILIGKNLFFQLLKPNCSIIMNFCMSFNPHVNRSTNPMGSNFKRFSDSDYFLLSPQLFPTFMSLQFLPWTFMKMKSSCFYLIYSLS